MTDSERAVQMSAGWLLYYSQGFPAMKLRLHRDPCVHARVMHIFMEHHFWPYVRQLKRMKRKAKK